MVIENKLLKEKINAMMESFKRIEEKRDSYIKEMEVKVNEADVLLNTAQDRKKAEAKQKKILNDVQGQNETLKAQI